MSSYHYNFVSTKNPTAAKEGPPPLKYLEGSSHFNLRDYQFKKK